MFFFFNLPPHLKKKQGLPGQGRHLQLSERLPKNLRAQTEESGRGDLFCLVKHEMSDEGLSQETAACLAIDPHGQVQELSSGG